MAIVLSQSDYWELFNESEPIEQSPDLEYFETNLSYPKLLGQGYRREIELRDGLDLSIAHYQLHDAIIVRLPEREHPLEYSFHLAGGFGSSQDATCAGQYCLWGSGLAPVEITEWHHTEQLEINVHLDPSLFTTWLNQSPDSLPPELQSLVQRSPQPYSVRPGVTTPAMYSVLQQILHCPFRGVTKRMYLESKVWELMALLIAQELEQHSDQQPARRLKPDDVERIHQAKIILFQRLDNPPSLIELARQVGLNDCTLKRGFRQVFGQTAFGLLHDYRLEQARQLLEERRLNVSEIAQAIGFANRSYFAAAFRKKFGVSPREYLSSDKNSA
ncbi:helix-turn-helix transcriptional regulator [Leptolyngbya ohadii]|uniref:helix-turn-helix transcriptional regulator n=1 Tax=Leptolyngbya ohadii TaxID=1962290 RepID=UPI000B5A05DB|nr:AraC family transcriptional regulator [Leptolyngbya ohadii]